MSKLTLQCLSPGRYWGQLGNVGFEITKDHNGCWIPKTFEPHDGYGEKQGACRTLAEARAILQEIANEELSEC